jgi:CDP-paratose 2-epimerase
MKLLVTGGCGFLGSNITSFYLRQGASVVVMDALFRKGAQENLNWLQQQANVNQFAFYKIDIAESEKVNAVFQSDGPFDYVCHFGGQVAMTSSMSNPRRDLLTNVIGTFNILEAIRQYSPEALLAYSSTNKVYGDLKKVAVQETPTRYILPDYPAGLNESAPLDFASPYGCSKGSADQYVRDWHRNFGLKTVVFRHSSIYGGRQYASYDQGWIGWFCQKALEQKKQFEQKQKPTPFTISGTGKQVRDVLHADDLVLLYHAAWMQRDNIAGEIFNIGGGVENSLSLLELFELLQELLDFQPRCALRYDKMPRRQSDQDVFIADISKSCNLMHWKPEVKARSGISRMLKWVSSDEANQHG